MNINQYHLTNFINQSIPLVEDIILLMGRDQFKNTIYKEVLFKGKYYWNNKL